MDNQQKNKFKQHNWQHKNKANRNHNNDKTTRLAARLNSITIEGFKSFQKLENFSLNSLNILVGANGAGKSNFLNFFEMIAWMFCAKRLQEYILIKGGAQEFLYQGKKQITEINSKLQFTSPNGKTDYSFRLLNSNNKLVFSREQYRFSKNNFQKDAPQWQDLGMGHPESKINDTPNPTTRILHNMLQHCTVYQFHDTTDNSAIKQDVDINDKVYLKQDGRNLAAILYQLAKNEPKKYEEIERIIEQLLPMFGGFELEPIYNKISLRWRQKYEKNTTFGANLTSDGTLRLMALVTLLCMPENRISDIILLDEPELGLHPYAIEIVADLIKRLSITKQIIVATQSPQLLNYFAIENIIVTKMSKDGTSSLNRLEKDDYKEWLEDFQLGYMWQTNLFGGNP